MRNYLEERIYPLRKHILLPSNNDKFNVEDLFSNEFIDTAVEEMYEQIRTFISSNNAFCLVKEKNTNAIFIYEYDLNANCTFKIAGHDEEGIPFLELLH